MEDSYWGKVKIHFAWLDKVCESGLISEDTSYKAKYLWWSLKAVSHKYLPIPSACTGPDKQMCYYWDYGIHHLEIEIIPEKPIEFYYRNRETNEHFGEDYILSTPFPPCMIDKLILICEKNYTLPHEDQS